MRITLNTCITGFLPEIAGKAGMGKTQICLQLCATVQVSTVYELRSQTLRKMGGQLLSQVPAELGGLGGRAVYLDTEGDFCGERMAEVQSCLRSQDTSSEMKMNDC